MVRHSFIDDGVHVASVLSYGAMVNCYAQPRPSRLLRLTHRLDHPHRRLSETSQFVLHLMATDPFGDAGAFVPTIQKTRLIHAAVRHFVTESGEWDAQADGVPICQQDLLGALMIFSVQVIQGMRRMGIDVTETEAEEFSREQVESTYGPSPEGIALTRGLLDVYEQLVPGKIFDGVVPAMVRQVVNPDVADWLEIPKSRGWTKFVQAATGLMRMSEHAENSSKLAKTVLDRAGQLLLGGSVRMLNSGETSTLDIPADLRDHWSAAGHCPARD